MAQASVPKCATLSTLFHPKVLNLPYLPHRFEKAKLKCLTTISASFDPTITDLMGCLDLVKSSLSIPNGSLSIFSAAVQSITQDTLDLGRVIENDAPLTWNPPG